MNPHNMNRTDVCLIIEGCFPYVRGGVGNWIYNLIKELSDIDFSFMVIWPSPNIPRKLQYILPHNVKEIREVFVFANKAEGRHRSGSTERLLRVLKLLDEDIYHAQTKNFDKFLEVILSIDPVEINLQQLFQSREAWASIVELHENRYPDESFIDLFWTWRCSRLPLFNCIKAEVPPARIYHCLSTGYSGFLGVLASKRFGSHLLLTEHGIYTQERKLELASAEWLYEKKDRGLRFKKELSPLRQMWLNVFKYMGLLAYHHCDLITTIFEGNRDLQVLAGAPEEKIWVIPNGIDVERFSKIRRISREKPEKLQVGFVGRVVPIKDINTFLKACRILKNNYPKSEFFIIGPYDEDPIYYEECKRLSSLLGLDDCLKFTGAVDVEEYYSKLHLVVLTSIKEVFPLAILEANAAGIPVVVSDVGACRGLLYGVTPEDRELGHSGVVARVANPEDTANALLKLINDPSLYEKMSNAGRERVRRFYNQKIVYSRYRELYQRYL